MRSVGLLGYSNNSSTIIRLGSFSTGCLEIRQNDGQGNFSKVNQRIAPWKAQAFALGDLDEDGDLDVFAAWFKNRYAIWFNRGDGKFKS